ncbi:hypothetical protein CB1_002313018 [Camelus ferus]|nr:hypothetical protein CB1_002313018 [Camelus ferus]
MKDYGQPSAWPTRFPPPQRGLQGMSVMRRSPFGVDICCRKGSRSPLQELYSPTQKAHMGTNSLPCSHIQLSEPNDAPKSPTALHQFDKNPSWGDFLLRDCHAKLWKPLSLD